MKSLAALEKKNIEKLVKYFGEVYSNDDLMKYFFPKEESRNNKIESLFRYKLKSSRTNCFQITESASGVIFLQSRSTSQRAKILSDLVYGIKLAWDVGIFDLMRLIKFQMFSDRLLNQIGGEKCIYVDLFMVNKKLQGKGLGTRALNEVLNQARQSNNPVYLETLNLKNVKYYESFGFRVVSEPKIPGSDLKYYCMIKEMNVSPNLKQESQSYELQFDSQNKTVQI